jgi:hypothetical protein
LIVLSKAHEDVRLATGPSCTLYLPDNDVF